MATQLRVLDGRPVGRGRPSPNVTLPRHLVVGAAMDAETLAEEITQALAGIEQCMWSGNRAGAVNAIGRAHHRIAELRSAFLALAGIADHLPSDPADAIRVA